MTRRTVETKMLGNGEKKEKRIREGSSEEREQATAVRRRGSPARSELGLTPPHTHTFCISAAKNVSLLKFWPACRGCIEIHTKAARQKRPVRSTLDFPRAEAGIRRTESTKGRKRDGS